MDLTGIANELVAGCREGRERENLDRLYATDAVSVEPYAWQGVERVTQGLAAIRRKQDAWSRAHEQHALTVEGPFLHGDDRFAVIFDVDATDMTTGKRFTGREVGVYHVAGGRIVREEFYIGG